jgi:hypothetical protein
MSKVIPFKKTREPKMPKALPPHEGFEPCSQDMTLCGDCEGNRAANKCPRLKEWLAKRR